MGVLVQVDCLACGYAVQLLSGLGFEGVEIEPRRCLDCREIVNAVVGDRLNRQRPSAEFNRCPDCGGRNLQALGDDAPDRYDARLCVDTCPRCGASLSVYHAGTWD